jgi:tol-pal system protein YbgF
MAATKEEAETAAPRRVESQSLPESRAKAESATPAKKEGELSVMAHKTGNDLFSEAATEFAAQRYDTAIENLRAFLTQYPKDGRAPDARFLLADAYLAQGRYAEAGTEFAAFLRQYPEHRRAPAALYRQGEVRVHLGDQSGCAILRDALTRNPSAREAASARETLSARCP